MKKLFRLLKVILVLCILATFAVLTLSTHVKTTTAERIITLEQASGLEDVDCIMVLGCGLRDDGTPAGSLNDRLSVGIDVYFVGGAPKLLMSGDHGRSNYDEVNAMKQFALDASVPSEDVFMDHAGFSTYESVYRAKEIFGVDKMIIVTQEYHLHRALYIAQKLGVEAYGVSADIHSFGGQHLREIREALARSKDFFTTIFKPQPTYLGEAIDVSGNGDVTND